MSSWIIVFLLVLILAAMTDLYRRNRQQTDRLVAKLDEIKLELQKKCAPGA